MRLTEEDLISETAYRLGGLNHLNLEIMIKLDKALDKVTIELLEGLKSGETIELSESYEIYRYEDDDCIVIIDTDEDEEVFCIQYNRRADEIIFNKL